MNKSGYGVGAVLGALATLGIGQALKKYEPSWAAEVRSNVIAYSDNLSVTWEFIGMGGDPETIAWYAGFRPEGAGKNFQAMMRIVRDVGGAVRVSVLGYHLDATYLGVPMLKSPDWETSLYKVQL